MKAISTRHLHLRCKCGGLFRPTKELYNMYPAVFLSRLGNVVTSLAIEKTEKDKDPWPMSVYTKQKGSIKYIILSNSESQLSSRRRVRTFKMARTITYVDRGYPEVEFKCSKCKTSEYRNMFDYIDLITDKVSIIDFKRRCLR